jgi:cytochrome c556
MAGQGRQRGVATVAGALAAAAMVLGSGMALAQTAEQAINYRKGAYQVIGWHFTPLVQMIKGSRPFDAALYVRNAEMIQRMGQVVGEGFIAGSETGAATRALPAIWSNAAGFKSALERFQGEASKLVAVGKSGDEKAMRAQVAEVARACSNCHDNFRAK